MPKNSTERMLDAMVDVVRSQTKEAVCAPLYDQDFDRLKNPLVDIFKMQKSLQDKLAQTGRALDIDNATFEERVRDISIQWRNMTLEFAELLERLPYKEWKTYSEADKMLTTSEQLEVQYEYIDMFHFFLNIGLLLGIDGEKFEQLYVTKNKENFDRQKRGY